MATVGADHIQKLALVAINKRTDRNKKFIRADRMKRPFLHWLEKNSQGIGFAGEKLVHHLKKDSGLGMQSWAGDVTLQTASPINNALEVETSYANLFMNWKLVHDHYRKYGYTIMPNSMGQTVGGRVKPMSGAEFERLAKIVDEDVESFSDSWDRNIDLAVHLQGTASTDLVGLASILPQNMLGTYAGHYRTREPLVQHVCFAGAAGATGVEHIGPSGTVSTSSAKGTLIPTLEKAVRLVKARAALSGMTSGRWVIFAGSSAIDKLKRDYRHWGISYDRSVVDPGKVDLSILDEDLVFGRMPVIWDPTLDYMDVAYSTQRALGLAGGSVSFSGGAGSGAKAVVYTSAAGVITDVVLTDRGSGYTSAPTVTVAGLGTPTSGNAATFQAYYYGTGSAGTGKVVVEADDSRIGQLAYIAVTDGGAGYTAASSLNFSDTFFILWEPSWEFMHQDGLHKHLSIPPDSARARATEVQADGTYFLRCLFNRAQAVVHAGADAS